MSNIANRIQQVKATVDLSVEPVSLADVKAYGLISYTDYDVLITALTKTARKQLENYTGKSFGVKTIECTFGFNGKRTGIRLAQGPVNEITALQYRSCACPGVEFADIFADPNYTSTWEVRNSRFYGMEGEYIATYTTAFDPFPDELATAIKAQAMFLFDNKEDTMKQGGICPVSRALAFPFVEGDMLL